MMDVTPTVSAGVWSSPSTRFRGAWPVSARGRCRPKRPLPSTSIHPKTPIYHKSDILYGLYQAKNAIVRQDSCYLVEGYTDVISMHQAGVENVVASSGTSLTDGQIRLIKRLTQNITVLYDGDTPGIKASFRGIDMLLAADMNVRVLTFPDNDDPDSFARKHTAEQLKEYLEKNRTDFIDFKARMLLEEASGDPILKSRLVRTSW